MNSIDLTPIEKLTKARIQLQRSHPFWAYLSLGLRFQNFPKGIADDPHAQTAGVDAHGNLYYNDDFINKLSITDTKTLLAHEVSHVAYSHLLRVGTRHKQMWNVAADYVVNDILLRNNFPKMEGMLLDSRFSEKSTEEVYEELLQNPPPNLPLFDTHMYSTNGGSSDDPSQQGMRISPSQVKAMERKWKRKLVEAYEHSKKAGNAPAGMERLIDNLLHSKVSWRTILTRYILNRIPFDWTYRKPSKISRVLKTVYLPSTLKESIDIIVGIDTSCSIGEKELALFKGDMLNISNSFQQVNMHVITCDTKVYDDFTLTNGTRTQFEKLKLQGGGGTDLRKIFDRVTTKGMNTPRNILIMFTDGYTPFPDSKPPINTIWVSTEASKEDYPKWGQYIRVEVK
jgi:predicted metal-dependent peptidase